MVLEACVLCIDNSDWTRNGDYQPSRWDSQIEAVNLISESKCDKNPENCLGVISMAGKRVETPVTLTTDLSKLLKSFKEIKISGESDFVTAVNISMLLLKHRQNKNQKQRILLFVASPVKNSTDELVLLGKKLKKNNVAIDIISFGNTDQNREGLNQLYFNANNSNNSSFLEVGLDQYVVDCLFTSPILNDNFYDEPVVNQPNDQPQAVNNNQVPNNNAQAGGLSQFERDINLAIQQSMEEEERRNKEKEQPVNNITEPKSTTMEVDTNNKMDVEDDEDEDLEAQLEKARLLSIQEHEKLVKKEKEDEKKMKDELIDNEDFIKGVLDEIGIKEENKDEDNDDGDQQALIGNKKKSQEPKK